MGAFSRAAFCVYLVAMHGHGALSLKTSSSLSQNFTCSPQVLPSVESQLRKSCGEACVDDLHTVLRSPRVGADATQLGGGSGCASTWVSALALLSERALRGLDDAGRLQETSQSSSRSIAAHQQLALPLKELSTDTACATPMTCKLRGMIANKCNYGREALQAAYQGINIAAHVMGVLITQLCGCLYVHEKVVCLLGSVPEVCVFPYNVYSKTFAGSIQMWEAIKGATKSCMLHGDASIAS